MRVFALLAFAPVIASAQVSDATRKDSTRKLEAVTVSAIRAGHTYSSHIVGIDAPAETLELHHASRSAMAYADGALRVAAWVHGRKGIFTMDQFSEETLDPLFRQVKP